MPAQLCQNRERSGVPARAARVGWWMRPDQAYLAVSLDPLATARGSDTLTKHLGLRKFFDRLRPIFAQQTRECAISEKLAARLTRGTVVRFVRSVANALHFLPAARARFLVTPMHGHPTAKRSDFFGERVAGFFP